MNAVGWLGEQGVQVSKKRSRQTTKLDMTVSALNHRFGARSLTRGIIPQAGETGTGYPHISTGFSSLDDLLSIGGLPRGKITELVGMATSGKTTLALKFLAQAQQMGQQVGYIDQSRYFDPDYAHRCGIDLARLVIGSPYDVTETLTMVEALANKGGLAALVLDTVDFLWSDTGVMRQLNATLSRISAPLARSGTAFVFLHDPLLGEASALSVLKHYASIRLQVSHETWQHSHGDIRGYRARIVVLKSRFGPTGRETTIDIKFNGTVQGDGL
jgi:recombination protein RecA